jgi:Transposase IS116/IS110/IS902 family
MTRSRSCACCRPAVRRWVAQRSGRRAGSSLDYLGEPERLDARLKELKKHLADALDEHPTTLLEINGVGPINAAKVLAEVGDFRRFPSRHHFASYTSKRCAASNGDSPTSTTDTSSTTWQQRARENKGGVSSIQRG